jgi:glucans biosynthesis protein
MYMRAGVPLWVLSRRHKEGVGVSEKATDNSMHLVYLEYSDTTLRCGAHSLGSALPRLSGQRKKRCRMHHGAQGSGAPKGERNGNYMHGRFTCKAIEARRQIRAFLKQMRAPANSVLKT